jgi:hypothetical protein
MIILAERLDHRAALRGIPVQRPVQVLRREAVGQVLGALPVVDPGEGVVGQAVADAFGGELPGQPAMAVAVELQPERAPGGDAQMDQPECGVDEIEIVGATCKITLAA